MWLVFLTTEDIWAYRSQACTHMEKGSCIALGEDGSLHTKEKSHKTLTLLTPWYWTSILHNCEKINLFCSSHLAGGILFDSPSWLTQHILPKGFSCRIILLSNFLHAFQIYILQVRRLCCIICLGPKCHYILCPYKRETDGYLSAEGAEVPWTRVIWTEAKEDCRETLLSD